MSGYIAYIYDTSCIHMRSFLAYAKTSTSWLTRERNGYNPSRDENIDVKASTAQGRNEDGEYKSCVAFPSSIVTLAGWCAQNCAEKMYRTDVRNKRGDNKEYPTFEVPPCLHLQL